MTTKDAEINGYAFMKTSCMHCADPSCVSACPVTAMTKDPVTGVVAYDPDACVGCRYCVVACPFGIPKYQYDSPTGEDRQVRTVPASRRRRSLLGLRRSLPDRRDPAWPHPRSVERSQAPPGALPPAASPATRAAASTAARIRATKATSATTSSTFMASTSTAVRRCSSSRRCPSKKSACRICRPGRRRQLPRPSSTRFTAAC
jgi:Fe-S-cluster-containing hydrogenase component 2